MSNSRLSKQPKIVPNTIILNNADVINNLLSSQDIDYPDKWHRDSTLAIFVHSLVFEEFQKLMERNCLVKIINSYDYKLQICDTTHHMKLVYVQNINDEVNQFIRSCIFCQTYNLFFKEVPHLFITTKRFHELQFFIRQQKIENGIVNIETRPGLIYDISGETDITVVTFNVDCYHIYTNFHNTILRQFTELPPAYYVNIAFPWLQPSRIKHLGKPISQKSYLAVHQYLTCLREISYDKEPPTNLFDLCNLKLAFCDDRGMDPWNTDLVFEINSLIIRLLEQLKTKTNLFPNNQFNIRQYTSDRDLNWSMGTVEYFQYSFQDYFCSIKKGIYADGRTIPRPHHRFRSLRTITLIEKYQDLIIIRQNKEAPFEIDCTNFARMNIFTFINLIKYRNVKAVILDTNHKWLKSKKKILLIISLILMSFEIKLSTLGLKFIKCFGKNTYNFVENFLSAIKKFQCLPAMRFVLNWQLPNYDVFNETRFEEIVFYDITIDSHMLEQLHICKLNSKISLFDCYLKNDTKVWDLICTMDNLEIVQIVEDETTWLNLFEFVANKFERFDLKEFSLSGLTKSKIIIRVGELYLDLKYFVFVMDSTNTKIDLTLKGSGEQFDIYYERNRIADDKSEYDFYN